MSSGNEDKSASSGCSSMASLVLLVVAPRQGAKGQPQVGFAQELGGAHSSNILKDAGL